jgi:hypothetical protein
MNLERIILTLAGAVGIAAFFFPFLRLQPDGLGEKVLDIPVSGYSYTLTALDAAEVYDYPEGKHLLEVVGELFQNSEKLENKALWAGVMLVLTGPIFFVLFSLGHFIRGLAGKPYKRGIFFALLFTGFAWLIFFLLSGKSNVEVLGHEIGLQFNFFKMAGLGFWMAAGSVLAAAFSLFFSKNLDS